MCASCSLESMVAVLRSLSDCRALDVASGRGRFISTLLPILPVGASFTGVDINQERIDEGRKSLAAKPVTFATMDAAKLEYADSSFDLVTIRDALHNLDDVERVLAEMVRVLRSGGLLLIEEPIYEGVKSPALDTTRAAFRWLAQAKQALGKPGHLPLSKADLLQWIDGLTLDSVSECMSPMDIRCFLEDPSREPPALTEDSPEFLVDCIEHLCDRIRSSSASVASDLQSLAEEAEALKERLGRHGTVPARYFVCLGRMR